MQNTSSNLLIQDAILAASFKSIFGSAPPVKAPPKAEPKHNSQPAKPAAAK